MSNGDDEDPIKNCILEYCCTSAQASAALATQMREAGCRTPEDYAAFVLKNYTLEDRSYVKTKKNAARLVRSNGGAFSEGADQDESV